MGDWLSRCNQNKRKTVAPHITHLMCSLVLLLTISLQLVEAVAQVPSVPLHFYPLHLQSYRNHVRKVQGSDKRRFDSSEKDCYFLKIPKWQHKLVHDYKWGKLVSYFLNNATGSFHVKWMEISRVRTWPISDSDETFSDERYIWD